MTEQISPHSDKNDTRYLDPDDLLDAVDEQVDKDLLIFLLEWTAAEADDSQVSYAARRAASLRNARVVYGGEDS